LTDSPYGGSIANGDSRGGSVGVKERKERERAEVREKILDVAREMFSSDGVEAVTMRAIAERIEYSPPVIYSHFADKHALIRELCYRDFRALAQALGRIGRIDDPIERLRKIGQAYVDFALDHPEQFRFMFMTVKSAEDLEAAHAATKGNPEEDAYSFLRNTVAEGIAAGRFRAELTDVEELSQIAWASAHGVVALHLAKGNDPWIDWRDARKMARKLVDATMVGLTREAH
jgi:AcrR family transcriptional regulator